MPTLTQIRDAIAAKMATVTGIGLVHKYERFAKGEKDFRAFYEYNGQIRGWNIRRITRSETSKMMGSADVINRWRIRGFMSMSDADASELAFDGLVEGLCAAFRADETLGGLIASTVMPTMGDIAGLQEEDSGPVMFAGVLCHSASLILYTWHINQ